MRISKKAFADLGETSAYPKDHDEFIDVGKKWEAIMYILNEGEIGRSPLVNLFIPDELIVTYKDEWQESGIRYHTPEAVAKLYTAMQHKSLDELFAQLDMADMSRVAYGMEEAQLPIVRQQIEALLQFFERAVANQSYVLGEII